MRIRSTKPEFWRSERIASVNWDARLVLKGLESYVDDNGVGKDDLALIVGDVFPRDMVANPRDTLARVSEALTTLSEAGLLHRYTADGTRLLYVAFWEDIQRIDKPGKGRLPRPDGTTDYGASRIRESVASPRETLAPGTEEQGNRGTEEQGKKTRPTAALDEPDEFDTFWAAYPRRDAKGTARTAWAKAVRKADARTIIAAARRYAGDPNRDPGFTALPASWLNAERWEDGPLPHRPTNNGRSLDPQADLLRAEMARAQAADAAHVLPNVRQIGAR